MILPTKGVEPDRALIRVGAEVIGLLDEPKTISRIWHELRDARQAEGVKTRLTYDWFVLALDLLFVIGVVQFNEGRLKLEPCGEHGGSTEQAS